MEYKRPYVNALILSVNTMVTGILMSDLSDAQFRISQDITGLSQQPAELNK